MSRRRGRRPRRGAVALEPPPRRCEPSALDELRGRGRLRYGLALLGPAFVAAVAYVDPGNFATNIAGGSKYGYLLLWVVLAANLMAMLIQYLSAKVGIATGHNLPELCREHFPRRASIGLWIQAELIAMATDLAEFVGAAIALNLLFGVPLFVGGADHRRRRVRDPRPPDARLPALRDDDRRACSGSSCSASSTRSFQAGARRERRRPAASCPGFEGTESILLATGILGATVMPHVIYLHSALTPGPDPAARRRRAARAAALRAPRRGHRDGHRRHREHLDAARRRGPVPRRHRHRLDRGRLRRLPRPGRRRRGDRVRGRAAGVRACRARASAPTPARSSCRASSAARSRCCCAA